MAPGAPWGTLVVNVLGCWMLGLLLPLAADRPPTPLLGFLTIGCIGAFTTFSTFAYEVMVLLEARQVLRAAGYLAASLVLGLCSVAAGVEIGRMLW